MQSTLLIFRDKHRKHQGGRDSEEKGQTTGGFESNWQTDLVGNSHRACAEDDGINLLCAKTFS